MADELKNFWNERCGCSSRHAVFPDFFSGPLSKKSLFCSFVLQARCASCYTIRMMSVRAVESGARALVDVSR